MIFELLAISGSLAALYVLWENFGDRILKVIIPQPKIVINGRTLKCDHCDNNATRMFNKKKKCEDHQKKIVILKTRKSK